MEVYKGAVSTLEPTDWSNEFGGSIIQYIESIAGKVLPISLNSIVESNNVTQRIAIVNKKKNKFLFTVGLFTAHNPMLELFIVLPADWNMNDNSGKNQFPLALLLTVSEQVKQGLQIEEGFCINAEDSIYSHLPWPENLAGFCVCDHYWGRKVSEEEKNEIDEYTVHLWTLIPVKKTKKGFPKQDVEKNKKAGWAKLTLKLGK